MTLFIVRDQSGIVFILKKRDEDRINANKILHSSAKYMYIQNMKITRSLCKKLLMIKGVKCFSPSIFL